MLKIAILVCIFLSAGFLERLHASQLDTTAASSLAQLIDNYLSKREAPFPFSGSVLVALNGDLILSKGYGFADAELAVPNEPTKIYRIGSLTKPFTATATMSLVEHHQVSLDDSICKYLRQCPEAWRPVKIRHLLSHSSGIPDLFNSVNASPVETTRDEIDQAVSRAATKEDFVRLDAEPGTIYAYRNFNYMLLGYVTEVVSGQPFFDAMNKLVLGPAHTAHTAYDDVWAIVPNRARGYAIKDGKLRNITYKDHSAYAAGGLRSSLDDLWKFSNAFLAGEIVRPETVQQMLTPNQGDYGFGWQIKTYFGQRMFNHSGGIDGFASHLAIYPNGKLVIIVLSNNESEPAKATACSVAAIVLTTQHRPVDSCPSF